MKCDISRKSKRGRFKSRRYWTIGGTFKLVFTLNGRGDGGESNSS